MNIGNKPTVVDLFCGCGGFGLGAELAGFHTVAAVDIDTTLQSAYQYNFPNTNVITADLSEINKSDWKTILNGLEIDGVIGGPPCQGYSRMGAGDLNDPRRLLLKDFYRHVNILKPKFFIMENVEGLMDAKNVSQLTEAIKCLHSRYTVLEPFIIDSSDYGAPTKRKRVIVVGYDKSRMAEININELLSPKTERVTVRDAIADIREPIKQNTDNEDYGWHKYKNKKLLSRYAKAMRKRPPAGLGAKQARNYLAEGMLSGHFDTSHTDHVKARYASLEPGVTDSVSRAKKLAWDGLCPTLRAGTGSDKGSHQAVRPIHPSSPRVITVREAARLQGFPDWFCFHQTKWHSFRMIGNSVSPIISNMLLRNISQLIKTNKVKLAA